MKKILLLAGVFFFHAAIVKAQKWSIDVDYAESCECDAPCPCLIGNDPTHRQCTGNSIIIIKKGYLDTVNIDGLKMYVTFELGEWSKVYVDPTARQAQIEALKKILTQPGTVPFLFEGKLLSLEKVPVMVTTTDSTFSYSVPDSYTQIKYLKGKDGKPVSLQNLRSNFASNNKLAQSVKLEHTGDDKAFSYSGTHGMVTHFTASGVIKP